MAAHCEHCKKKIPANGQFWTAQELYDWSWENPVFVEMELMDRSYPYPLEEQRKASEMWEKRAAHCVEQMSTPR